MTWQVGLYVAAVLIPLAAFVVEIVGIRLLGRLNAYLATGAIGLSFLLSAVGFFEYFFVEGGRAAVSYHEPVKQVGPSDAKAEVKAERRHAEQVEEHEAGARHEPLAWKASVDWVSLGGGVFPNGPKAPLTIPLAVRIDNLAVIMFLMVTFVATLIHIYSMGYMHDDRDYPRFFAYLSQPGVHAPGRRGSPGGAVPQAARDAGRDLGRRQDHAGVCRVHRCLRRRPVRAD